MTIPIRILLVLTYILCYFYQVFSIEHIGPILNTTLLFVMMLSFVKRKLAVINYLLSIVFIAFYVYLFTTDLFNYPALLLGLQNKWWLYAVLYCVLMIVFGFIVIVKRSHDSYQIIRTFSLIFFQLFIAFMIPYFMFLFGQKEYYLSYFWPLKIEYFYPSNILQFPLPFILYSFLGSLVLFPILAIVVGKRFYCSWVCGCGGLAETLGDRWRHLSDKSANAWRFEQITIHSVLGIAIVSTIIIIINWAVGESSPAFSAFAFKVQELYGYFVGFALAGAAGVGFYPVLGSRIWCRFFCPMAAMIGLIQKIGRYQITVKDDMCISCGNCSTFCEMGIDVRAYAQNNHSFTRASCVGCGICAHVCPRGVLKLENSKKILKRH